MKSLLALAMLSIAGFFAPMSPGAADPSRMVRTHSEWTWTSDRGEDLKVARSDLFWAKDDDAFPKHNLRSITLFQDQAGHRWILNSQRRESPDRYVVSLHLVDTAETVIVSMTDRNGRSFFSVRGCGAEYEIEKGHEASQDSLGKKRDLSARLSPAFLAAFDTVRPWIENGYLGVNAQTFTKYAFDLSSAEPLDTLVQVVFQPLRPVPVDCSFDAAFGFPCSPGETPRDSKGMILDGHAPPPSP